MKTTRRLLGLFLTFVLTFNPALAAAGDESPRHVDQMRGDFASGKIGYEKESFTQSIDVRTFVDLNLQRVIQKLVAEAPSRLAKDRLAWLLAHPFLDAGVIRARQNAVRQIAEDDELFDVLANTFEAPKRFALITKFNAIFKDSTMLSRANLTRAMPRHRFLHWSTFGSMLLIGLSAFVQYDLVTRGMTVAADPNWKTALSALLPLGILIGSSFGYRAHLPAVEMKRRARQLKRLLRKMDLDGNPSELLAHIGAECKKNERCARGVLKAGALLPVNNALAMVARLLGLAPYVAFPGNSYARSHKVPVLSLVALMTELETLYTIAKQYRARKDEVVWPTIQSDGVPLVDIEEGKHPLMWLGGKDVAPYTIKLNQAADKTMILTGPNTGGKTTAQQTYLVSSILAMAGYFVPAKAMSVAPGYVLTNFRARGSIASGTSSFQAQAERVADVVTFAQDPNRAYPVYIGMDEILRGTSGPEHRAFERATLHAIHETPGALLMLATHDRSLANMTTELNRSGEPSVFNMRVSLTGHMLLPDASTDFNAFDVMRDSEAPEVLIQNSLHYLNQGDSCAKPLEIAP